LHPTAQSVRQIGAAFIVIEVRHLAEMAEVKRNIVLALSDDYYLAPQSVRSLGF
jgi:hypothetical protein